MNKFTTLLKKGRIIILLLFIVLSLVAIHPTFTSDGVAIRNVAKNSSAAISGIENPTANGAPTSREVIISINNIPIKNEAEYTAITQEFIAGQDIVIKTNKRTYALLVKGEYEITGYEDVLINTTSFDNDTNETINITQTVEQPILTLIGAQDIGLTVYPRPSNNIRRGLDLEGGTRVLLEPEEEVSNADLDLVIDNIRQRLNAYGVSDVVVRATKDFAGKSFISVEIAGVNKDEVRELLSQQGKFEAKVGSTTVFLGGDEIAYVCRTADCSGIDPQAGCAQSEGQWFCRFRFQITLSPEAAEKQAAATKDLDVQFDVNGGGYLSQNLSLYLDDQLVDELRIAESLKGSAVTDISITGSGSGVTEREAIQNSLDSMKKLQTVLITGSLPVKLIVVKTDAISPVLGKTFLKNILLIGALAIIAVSVVVFVRYKKWQISLPMFFTMLSEVVILLGTASLIGWRLDLAAIAGIIIAVGTGVDDQIVIASEISSKELVSTWGERLKRAFFIIMASYFTTVVAMLPLWFAGAGLLKGFALTTILGVSIGVFITRPAYATVVEYFTKK